MKKFRILILSLIALVAISISAFANADFEVENGILTKYNGTDTNIVIPAEIDGENITMVGSFAFDGNQTVETVTVSEGVAMIETEAFKNCFNLKEVIIPESLSGIQPYAFSGCYNMNPVIPPHEWVIIDEDAYENADESRPTVFYLFDEYIMDGGTIISYNGTDAELVIPEEIDGVTVTAIGPSAFENNKTITSVVMPDTITKIGEKAFYNCTEMTKIKLSDNLSLCGKYALGYCKKLTELEIPGSLTVLGHYMLYHCEGLKSLIVNEGVKQVYLYSISDCWSLKSISLPSTLTTISSAGIYGCRTLETIKIPENVTILNSQTFRDCRILSDIEFPSNLQKIEYGVFYGCKLKNVEIPPSVTFINKWAFYGNTTMETFTIYNTERIGEDIFYGYNKHTVYAPQDSPASKYAEKNNVPFKSIVSENVAVIVGTNTLGTYGTLTYLYPENVVEFGMQYIPERLKDTGDVLDIKYETTGINNGDTFMSVMTGIPDEAMDWTYIATPYLKLKDGTVVWGNGKTFGLSDISTKVTMGE